MFQVTLLGTNRSHPKAVGKMNFLSHWWDMLVPRRVGFQMNDRVFWGFKVLVLPQEPIAFLLLSLSLLCREAIVGGLDILIVWTH